MTLNSVKTGDTVYIFCGAKNHHHRCRVISLGINQSGLLTDSYVSVKDFTVCRAFKAAFAHCSNLVSRSQLIVSELKK